MPRHVDSIKCGCCKERHTTVAQVRLCYQAKAAAADLTRREEFDAQVEAMADEAELVETVPTHPHADLIAQANPGTSVLLRDALEETVEAIHAAGRFEPRSFSLGGHGRRRPW